MSSTHNNTKRKHTHINAYESEDPSDYVKTTISATPSPLTRSKKSEISGSSSNNGSTLSSTLSGYNSSNSDMGVSPFYSNSGNNYEDDDEDDGNIEKRVESVIKSIFMDLKRESAKLSPSSTPSKQPQKSLRHAKSNAKGNNRYYDDSDNGIDNDDYLSSSDSDDFFDESDSISSINTVNKKEFHKNDGLMEKGKLVEMKFCMRVMFVIMNFYMETGCDKKRLCSFMLDLTRKNVTNEAIPKLIESFKNMKLFFESSFVPCIQSIYKNCLIARGFRAGSDVDDDVNDDVSGNQSRSLVRMGGEMAYPVLAQERALFNSENKFRTNFRNIERIGAGAFGKVFKAVNVLDGNTYAVKLVAFKASFNHNDESKIFKILREVNALAKLDHINVLRYYTCWVEIKESFFEPFGAGSHPHRGHHHHHHRNDRSSSSSSDNQRYIMDLEQDGSLPLQSAQFGRKKFPLIENISSESSMNSCGDNEEDTTDSDLEEEEEEVLVDEDGDVWERPSDFGISYDNEEDTEEEEEEEEEEVEEEEDDDDNEEDEDNNDNDINDSNNDNNVNNEEESIEITDNWSDDEESTENNESEYGGCNQLVVYNHKGHKKSSSSSSGGGSYSNNNRSGSLVNNELKFKCILYIQTQFCSGQTLRCLMDDPRWRVSHSQMFPIFHQILLGLEHIHDRGIIHRDLKPANIFLDIVPGTSTYIVKIGDFGLAKAIEAHGLQNDGISDSSDSDYYGSAGSSMEGYDQTQSSHTAGSSRKHPSHTTMIGTVPYISPEQMAQHEYTTKSDIYSLGIILFEMYNKFCTGSERAFAISDLRKTGEPPAAMKAAFPLQAELVSMMTAADQNVRPSAKELLVHKNVRELLASSRSCEDLEQEVIRLRALLAQKDKIIESLTQQNNN